MIMKHFRLLTLIAIALFVFNTDVIAQVQANVTRGFNIVDNGWKKIIQNGSSVTVFAYKHKQDIYSIGIYSDDYAGIIDLKFFPFDIEEKQLKKLPKADGKDAAEKLKEFYKLACVNARNNAFRGYYKTTAPVSLHPKGFSIYNYIKIGDPITIIGFKELRDFMNRPYYRYAILNNDCAEYFESSASDNVVINFPLGYLPSTDDSQVKAIISRENMKIIDRRQAEEKARKEEQERIKEEERRATAEREAAAIKEIKEEELAFLRNHAPAYIEIEGWHRDSANGISIDIAFKNGSSQKVKYVYFKGYFLNAVGDKCRNEINGSTEWKYRGVGPVNALPDTPYDIYYNHIAHWHFSNPRFYSGTANTFHLSSVTIEYMNGKKTTLSGAELKKRVRYL